MSASPQAVWVEILSRHGEVIARHRVDKGEVGVGRAYDNDVILDDPFVAPRHLRVSRAADGGLIAEDLGSANGLFDSLDKRVQRVSLDGIHAIRIGRTYLRVRGVEHAVPPERVAPAQARGRGWPLALALIAAMSAFQLLSTWLGQTGQPKTADYVTPLLTSYLFVLTWTAGWAIVSRIFTGRARFRSNLVVALAGYVALLVLYDAAEYAAFALSSRTFTAYRYIGIWVAAALVTYWHLRMVSLSHLGLKAAAVVVLALTAIGLQALTQSEARAASDRQSYVRRLKPPVLRLAPQETASAFFGQAGTLKARLDKARTEPVTESVDYEDDD